MAQETAGEAETRDAITFSDPSPPRSEVGVDTEKHEVSQISTSDDTAGVWDEGDMKKKQIYHGSMLLWVAFQATGVVYGDIGTSPLYVYSSTFTSEPSYLDLLGVLSLIIWSLTITVSIKYCFIVLQADDEGEGGTFALFSLLSRYVNIVPRDPGQPMMVKLERYKTNDLDKPTRKIRKAVEHSVLVKNLIMVLGVIGVTLVLADGVLTPAQSVLGAIQGIRVHTPDLPTNTIIGITCGILVGLFAIQPFGTSKLATSFGPIVCLWLLFNFAFGVYNCVKYDASVFKAFNPYYAGAYFVRNGTDAWRSLGGVLLAFTGVEALYADLGAFSKRAIQLSWIVFCFPCLLMAYIGQAAYISRNEGAYTNPFFNSVPRGTFWPSLILSILAAIVASQAIITATFQLLSQVMALNYFPTIKIKHTSKRFFGQIYIPSANWLLMGGTVLVTGVYNNTTSLGNAYGVCVILVTFVTTNLVALAAVVVWRLNLFIVLPIWLVLITFDGLFLSTSLEKVPRGAWFTIMLAVGMALIIFLWRFGKHRQWRAEYQEQLVWNKVQVKSDANKELTLYVNQEESKLARLHGLGIFMDKTGFLWPASFTHFIQSFEAVHEITVFFNIRRLQAPNINESERYTVSRVNNSPDTFRIIARCGYNDKIPSTQLSKIITWQLKSFLIREKEMTDPGRIIKMVDEVHTKQTVFVLGKELLVSKPASSFVRRVTLDSYIWIREQATSKAASFGLPVNEVVELGMMREI